MSTADFKSRTFRDPGVTQGQIHKTYPMTDQKSLDLDDEQYDWKYYGRTKYGRYAFCENTKTRRGLTMGEFYGLSPVD